ATILGGVLVLRVHISQTGLYRGNFVAADAPRQNLLAACDSVETPSVTFADQWNWNWKILLADNQGRFSIAIHLDLMLCVVSVGKSLAQIGIGNRIAG